MNKSVTFEEVISNFLAANEAKDENIISIIKNNDPNESLHTLLNKYRHLSQVKLFSLVKDKRRLQEFNQHSWVIKDVELKYVGTWPGVGDLPKEWCQLSVLDVASMIQENSNKFSDSKSIKKIHNIQENIDLVLKYFYPILVPGGEIRKDKNLLFMPFDADDGSHRLIAAALSGRKNVLAYVGNC
jgi:hypothetical protein